MTRDVASLIEQVRSAATELDHIHTRLTGISSGRPLAQEAEDLHSRLLIAAELLEKAATERSPSPTEIGAFGQKLARIYTDTAELVQKVEQGSLPDFTEGEASLRDRAEQVARQIQKIREGLPTESS